jgi:hypothetical protein
LAGTRFAIQRLYLIEVNLSHTLEGKLLRSISTITLASDFEGQICNAFSSLRGRQRGLSVIGKSELLAASESDREADSLPVQNAGKMFRVIGLCYRF